MNQVDAILSKPCLTSADFQALKALDMSLVRWVGGGNYYPPEAEASDHDCLSEAARERRIELLKIKAENFRLKMAKVMAKAKNWAVAYPQAEVFVRIEFWSRSPRLDSIHQWTPKSSLSLTGHGHSTHQKPSAAVVAQDLESALERMGWDFTDVISVWVGVNRKSFVEGGFDAQWTDRETSLRLAFEYNARRRAEAARAEDYHANRLGDK